MDAVVIPVDVVLIWIVVVAVVKVTVVVIVWMKFVMLLENAVDVNVARIKEK
jgi:hypothetical protein